MGEAASVETKSLAKTLVSAVPGLGLVFIATACAYALATLLHLPSVIVALIVGMALHPLLTRISVIGPGVFFAADPLMRIGVACLGAGVNAALLLTLGWPIFATLSLAISATILCGLVVGKWLGQSRRFSVLSAGAVAICGASAALAISCALPKTDEENGDVSVVIVAVSLLSAAGILLYPLLTSALALSDASAGFVLGGSLHNVAQAIAAGFSVSDPAGEMATLVKMSRVAMLAPIVMLVALTFRRTGESEGSARRLALPPIFLLGFLALMGASSANLIPQSVETGLGYVSKVCLLLAMTAIGLRTPIMDVVRLDRRAIVLLLLETVTILLVVLIAVQFIPI